MRKKYFSLLFLLIVSSKLFSQPNFELRYLGNMGVVIIHNDTAFIIDGLHDFYGADYLPTDSSVINAMLQKKKLFKHIIAIAVTHKHNDHFDSTLITAVANIHTTAVLIAGNQTKSLLGSDIQNRFKQIADSITIVIRPNLLVKLRKIPHINPARHAAVENYRMEIVWDGFRIVHFGDAAILPDAVTELMPSPNIIIVPDWFLAPEGQLLLQQLKPVKTIISHIAPSDKEEKKKVVIK